MEYIIIGGIAVIIILQLISLSKKSGITQDALNGVSRDLTKEISGVKESVSDKMEANFRSMIQENAQNQIKTMETLQSGVDRIQGLTEVKLTSMQEEVSKKLDVSLNERLDKNFEQITSQLSTLYKSLGELESMSDGIGMLNKTLSNVKTRGTWGEVQLGAIIEDTMQSGQYEKNVKLKSGSDDMVEYAIKIPSKEDDGEFIFLPIDAKFPADRYINVINASESGDKDAVNKAVRELEQRIKEEARTIRDKYIHPPITTDFAIMFLPTESMYAEVVRIEGLMEYCQNQYRIVISSPSTITALLNSLRLGFANIALNKKTAEVRKLLQAVKTQYGKLDELIDATRKKLDAAITSTDSLKDRARKIQKSMSKIDALDNIGEANALLEIEDNDE